MRIRHASVMIALALIVSWTTGAAKAAGDAATAPATAPTFVPSSSGPWIARLPSGIAVELLAVSRHPVDADGWWKPDGSAMTDAVPDGLMTEREYGGGQRDGNDERLYKFFIRYQTPDGKQRVLSPRLEDADARSAR